MARETGLKPAASAVTGWNHIVQQEAPLILFAPSPPSPTAFLRLAFKCSSLGRAVRANCRKKLATIPRGYLGADVDRVIGSGFDIGPARGRTARMTSFFVVLVCMGNSGAVPGHCGLQDQIQSALLRFEIILAVAEFLIDHLPSGCTVYKQAIAALGIVDYAAPAL